MNILRQAVRRIERFEALDKVARPLAGAVGRAVRPRVVRNLLSGTDLGHPLHPGADRPADRGVGDVGPAGRRRQPATCPVQTSATPSRRWDAGKAWFGDLGTGGERTRGT